jgi:phage major head subunit gpT-like protein
MFFKLVKADAKLVKAVCETNGLGQTESNEWNVLWTSQSLKPFLYETMSEF